MSIVDPGMESMLETFVHETETMLEQLDGILLESERAKSISEDNINSIFRITHTIKGSAAMMSFEVISNLGHSVEDVFYILREAPEKLEMVFDTLFDLVFQASDFFKKEIEKMQESEYNEGDASSIIEQISDLSNLLKGVEENSSDSFGIISNSDVVDSSYDDDMTTIRVYFEDDCQMENMRAFMLLTQMQHCCEKLDSIPRNPELNSSFSSIIIKDGFAILCKPIGSIDEIIKTIEGSLNIKSYEIIDKIEVAVEQTDVVENSKSTSAPITNADTAAIVDKTMQKSGSKQSMISVNQTKLDQLMDLVGELVTAESMVARNPDLNGLKLDNFTKSIRELRKLTDELQDIVMSIRMVSLQSTFHKMDRIVRDMSKKLDKKVTLVTYGGDTEVDKTVNDAIVDPLMHMIRNSMDHAIESPAERIALGKSEIGQVTLSARNVGGEILIDISDDGRGLIAESLLKKAADKGLLTKPESAYTEKEAFSLIMLAGFSTNSEITEFSGRGVGMDVVRKNLEQVNGTISITSVKNQGTTFTIKIPLTLAIVDGMNISIGNTVLTLPITSIRQSFKISEPKQIIKDTNGSEMILIRGECLPVLRLHELFEIETNKQNIIDGILIQVESSNSTACLFADELLGEYQVVVKPFPSFFNKYNLKNKGISGCSILGDGSISLILDANYLLSEI